MRSRTKLIAGLHPIEYAWFRERDPSLPAAHSRWLAGARRRVAALRRVGVDARLHPIRFDEFTEAMGKLLPPPFDRVRPDAELRDLYAEDMAAKAVAKAQRGRL